MRFSTLALLPLAASGFVLNPVARVAVPPLRVLQDPTEKASTSVPLTEKAAKLAKIEELKRVSSNLLQPLKDGE